jgi:molybdopterin synthase catalytic subunit
MSELAASAAAAVLPPPLNKIDITGEPLQLGALAATVVCPTAGGIATFAGTTRDTFEGKRVLRLEVRGA